MSELDSFRSELKQAGIPYLGQFIADDQVHRFKTGDDSDANSWYALHQLNGLTIGVAGCWKRGIQIKWTSKARNAMSKEDWGSASAAWKDLEAKRAAEERAAQDKARQRCQAFFSAFPKAQPGSSLYLIAKGVPEPHGPLFISTDSLTEGWLALPLQDADGTIHSAQFIADDGTKRFQYQGRVSGCFYPLSSIPGGPILICEGYATGASLYEATGWTVVCAMNCGNLMAVAKSLRQKWQERTIVICADNDQFTDGNPGLSKAREAAKACRCLISYPEFADEALANKPTDFNDLHQNEGLNEVRRQVFSAFPIIARPIGILTTPPPNDPTELLKYRYLCECGALLVNGSTGLGKSSLGIQAAACWCNEIDFFGIQPAKPLRVLIVQAENDDGDVAQMRDGICRGLGLNQDQRQRFFENVMVHCSRGLTGKRFCFEVLRPLLDLHQPHLLELDPMLAFLGGNVKEQEVVGEFVREYLNPLLFESKSGCMGLHHTNKPMIGKEKANWVNGELAYTGSGSAEWANWARAIIAIQSLGVPGYYTLHAAKRGGRLGWTTNPNTDSEAPLYEKPIAWSREKGAIYWRTPDQSELDNLEDAKSNAGRPEKFPPESILAIISNSPMTTDDWRKKAFSELNVPRATFYRIRKRLQAEGKIVQSILSEQWSVIKSRTTQNDD